MSHDIFEEIRICGNELADKVQTLIEEGNVRRMIIKNQNDETLLEVPLILGVAGMGGAFALAPVLSAIGAFALFTQDFRILVEHYPASEEPHLKNNLHRKRPNQRHSREDSRSRRVDPKEVVTDFKIVDP